MRQTLLIAIELASPFLLLALVIGLGVSLFQSMTQIQEMTLSFVPKIIGVAVAVALLFPWILKMMTKFTNDLLLGQWSQFIYAINSPY